MNQGNGGQDVQSAQEEPVPANQEEMARTVLRELGVGVRLLNPKGSELMPGGTDFDVMVFRSYPYWCLTLPRGFKVCQAFDYDIVGRSLIIDCRGSRVEIDTLDDPSGQGKYAFPTRADNEGGVVRLASPGTRASYLTSKRIQKRSLDKESWGWITELARSEPRVYRSLIREIFGNAIGGKLADAVFAGDAVDDKLWLSARWVQMRRRYMKFTGVIIILRQIKRIVSRLVRPTGVVVSVSGPDGTGKTTLSSKLERETESLFRRSRVFHWRPGLLPRPGKLIGSDHVSPADPHARRPHGAVVSHALLIYYWIDFLLGFWVRFYPIKCRSGLVLLERGWMDLAVDPTRYRLRVSVRLVKFLGNVIPKADIAIVLEAGPAVVSARKAELSQVEIARQTQLWRTLKPGRVTVFVDASATSAAVVNEVEAHVVSVLEQRTITRITKGWVGYPPFHRPRWTFPRDRRSYKAATSLYQPVTLRARIGWSVIRRLGGIACALPRSQAPPRHIREAVGPLLETGGTFALQRSTHPNRYIAMLINRAGAAHAIVKVAFDDEGREALRTEADQLRRFTEAVRKPLMLPRVLLSQDGLLVTEPVQWVRRRRPSHVELPLARAMGEFFLAGFDGLQGFAHGDFAPWNVLKTPDGWVLVDWEASEARAAPFHDIFHYLAQSSALLGNPTVGALLKGVRRRKGWVFDVLNAYGVGAELPDADYAKYMKVYLVTSLERLSKRSARAPNGDDREIRLREELLRRI